MGFPATFTRTFGTELVIGCNLVPIPATGMIAFNEFYCYFLFAQMFMYLIFDSVAQTFLSVLNKKLNKTNSKQGA